MLFLLYVYLPQDWELQAWLALSTLSPLVSPKQLAPPLAGDGLLQLRVRVCVPPPHVTLQVPQLAQPPQFPSTRTTVKTTTEEHKVNNKQKEHQNRVEAQTLPLNYDILTNRLEEKIIHLTQRLRQSCPNNINPDVNIKQRSIP